MTGGPRYMLGGLSESHNTNPKLPAPWLGGPDFFQGGQAPLAPPLAPALSRLGLEGQVLISDGVLEDKSLVSRLLEDRFSSPWSRLGLEGQVLDSITGCSM